MCRTLERKPTNLKLNFNALYLSNFSFKLIFNSKLLLKILVKGMLKVPYTLSLDVLERFSLSLVCLSKYQNRTKKNF